MLLLCISINQKKKNTPHLLLYYGLRHWHLTVLNVNGPSKTFLNKPKRNCGTIALQCFKKQGTVAHVHHITNDLSLCSTAVISHTHTHNTQWWKLYPSASWCLGGRQALETTTVKIKFYLRLIPFPTSAEFHCYCDSRGNLSQLFHCGNWWWNTIQHK